MSTVEAVSGEAESAAEPAGAAVPPEQRAGSEGSALGGSGPRSVRAGAGADRRSLLVPVLSTVVGALIAGLVALLVVGFNIMLGEIEGVSGEVAALRDDMNAEIGGLRGDMNAEIGGLRGDMNAEIGGLRGDMNAEIGGLRDDMDARFAQMDARFAQIDARFVQMDARFAQVDARFGEVSAVLLDHTDRLARIEAIHGAHSHVSGEAGSQG